ncbi:hypothetical protein [Vagococcus fluvialis]|uniref:hypothetical protein n=1 Tax=Vagococcus fluvialis TaxID=2738 RepID=UPI00288F80E9|nr:hypothetical protein [Vagococcus fluvialis]MDT2747041.1 hypothetical protein [Vagococcus fluvialis]
MTQENKLEWIKELAQELTEACNEQDLTLTMVIQSKEKDVITSGVCGPLSEIGKNLVFLDMIIEEQAKMPVSKIKKSAALSILREKNKGNKDDSLLGFLSALGSIAEMMNEE